MHGKVTYDTDRVERVRAVMYENGEPIISEVKAEAYFDEHDNEVYTEYKDAAKKVFEKLFSKYNPNFKTDAQKAEQNAAKKIDKLKKTILSNMKKEN